MHKRKEIIKPMNNGRKKTPEIKLIKSTEGSIYSLLLRQIIKNNNTRCIWHSWATNCVFQYKNKKKYDKSSNNRWKHL